MFKLANKCTDYFKNRHFKKYFEQMKEDPIGYLSLIET